MATSTSVPSGYRPHLDGIRAVAVVLVILFHLGFAVVPGGFVGVDVFFVLSGYLITGILLTEVQAGNGIGLRRFYARRARRLLPASIAVLLVVLAMAWWLFDPVQQQSLGLDATWAAFYSANWHFAAGGGDYFAPGDVPSPLVHFWSLAVEEQFYLVWPVLVLVLHRLANRWRRSDPLGAMLLAVLALAGVSAVVSITQVGSSLTYYGTHARAYQLLAGAALAIGLRRRPVTWPQGSAGRVGAVVLPVGALAALLALAHGIGDAARYPGWPGLAVTGVSLALIVGVDLPAVTAIGPRVLGHRSVAAVGRLSYSLYIWHWPVIVLLPVMAEQAQGRRDWLDTRATAAAATVALALLSYLAVERPIRFRLRPRAQQWRVVAVGLSASLATGLLAFVLFHPDNAFEQKALVAVRDNARPGPCPYFAEDWPAPQDSEPCTYRQGAGPVIAVVGDSHAQQWQPALEVLAERDDATIIRATRGGCPANDILAYVRAENGRNEADTDCAEWRHLVYPAIVADFDPDIVFVATRSHVRGIRADGVDIAPTDPDHLEAWSAGWGWTVDTLARGGAQVVLSEIIPTLPERVPACLIEQGEGTTACDFDPAGDTTVGPYNEVIADLDRSLPNVRVVDPTSIACPDRACPAVIDGEIVHRDDNHLSATYVRRNADAFERLLADVGAQI